MRVKLRTAEGYRGLQFPIQLWDNLPEGLIVNEETPTGQRVWIAGHPRNEVTMVRRVFAAGAPSYPYGGVEVVERGSTESARSFYFEAVMIHPDEAKIYVVLEHEETEEDVPKKGRRLRQKRGPRANKSIEFDGKKIIFTVTNTFVKYGVLSISSKIRPFFPGYKIPFKLNSMMAQITGAPRNTPDGHPEAGRHVRSVSGNDLKDWFDGNKIKPGDKLRLTKTEKKYNLKKL